MNFAPDIFIVENNCSGTSPELAQLLRNARALHHTRCVLALDSDINPPATAPSLYETLSQDVHDYYDQIWIYGDAQVEEAIHSITFAPLTRKKIRYTGYITPLNPPMARDNANKRDNHILLVFGQHAEQPQTTIDTLINALLDNGQTLTVLVSEHTSETVIQNLIEFSQTRPELQIETDAGRLFALLQNCDRTVAIDDEEAALGALAHNKPLLVIHDDEALNNPRIACQRLQQLDALKLTRVINSEELRAGDIRQWLENDDDQTSMTQLDFNGLERLPQLVGMLLTTDRRKSPR